MMLASTKLNHGHLGSQIPWYSHAHVHDGKHGGNRDHVNAN